MVRKEGVPMRKTWIVLIVALSSILCLCTSCEIDNLPVGQLIEEFPSPDGTYQINAYLVSGNATVDFSVRCEVVETASGAMRNIYWQYRCSSANVLWIDDHTVDINGIVLNVITDSYDWRNN